MRNKRQHSVLDRRARALLVLALVSLAYAYWPCAPARCAFGVGIAAIITPLIC